MADTVGRGQLNRGRKDSPSHHRPSTEIEQIGTNLRRIRVRARVSTTTVAWQTVRPMGGTSLPEERGQRAKVQRCEVVCPATRSQALMDRLNPVDQAGARIWKASLKWSIGQAKYNSACHRPNRPSESQPRERMMNTYGAPRMPTRTTVTASQAQLPSQRE